jgi:Icc-related predicted phosphoesterase
MIYVTAISDLHGEKPKLPGGDLLIIAGDLTANDSVQQYHLFCDWLAKQNYKKKIVVAGNHDTRLYENDDDTLNKIKDCAIYLENSGTEYAGLKIWGTPNTLLFDGVNLHCKAFMCNEWQLEHIYKLIPSNIDILISHGPAFNYLDTIESDYDKNYHTGSVSMYNILKKINPKIFICGHIHEHGGKRIRIYPDLYDMNQSEKRFVTDIYNVAIMDKNYKFNNKITTFLIF